MLFLSVVVISSGRFSRARVGVGARQLFAVFGTAVDEMRSAMALTEPGYVMLSPEAWRLCRKNDLPIKWTENEQVVKVGLKPFLNSLHLH